MAAPNILCDTAGMTNAQWLAARMHGPSGKIPYTVGGSDVAAVFGVSPWTTPLELWMIKKGRMKPPAKSNANQLEMGHLLEPIAAHWYAKKTGNRVYEDTNLYQHADHPYALANFDRRFERASDGEPGILECKSCTYHKASEWDNGAIPLYYELQLRFYLAVADVNIGSFSAIWGNNPDNDLAIPDITRDKAKEDMIFERLDEWIWSLEHDKPPTMSGVAPQLALESLARIYGESQSGLPTIEFSSKQENALRRIALLQGKITECNREIKTKAVQVKANANREEPLLEKKAAMLKRTLQRAQNSKLDLYEEYRNGRMTRDKFIAAQEERQTAIDSMCDELAATEAMITKLRAGKEKAAVLEADAKGIQLLNEYRPKELRKLIEKVRVYENGRIEIDFRCHDDFTEKIIKAVAQLAG